MKCDNNNNQEEEGEQFDFDSGDEVPEADRQAPSTPGVRGAEAGETPEAGRAVSPAGESCWPLAVHTHCVLQMALGSSSAWQELLGRFLASYQLCSALAEFLLLFCTFPPNFQSHSTFLSYLRFGDRGTAVS